jgi:IS1 family transposase
MNRLDIATQAKVISCLVEGCSIRATVRMTGVALNTIAKLLADIGRACDDYHDANVRNLKVRRLQCDEIWCFIGAKAKNTRIEKKAKFGWGDIWTWVGIDADTKLVVSYMVGNRDGGWAEEFMKDCASRIRNRVQITTDGFKVYLQAVENAFGADIDYAMLQKIYGAVNDGEARYSPAKCIGGDMKGVSGDPEPKHVSTSFVERQNLTMRMHMRRFTRLTNAFSKKLSNHRHSVALHYMFYNYCRVHQTLKVTPAMEAGLSDHVWGLEELCALMPKPVVKASTIEKNLLLKAMGKSEKPA